jgi:hypothetical protein
MLMNINELAYRVHQFWGKLHLRSPLDFYNISQVHVFEQSTLHMDNLPSGVPCLYEASLHVGGLFMMRARVECWRNTINRSHSED